MDDLFIFVLFISLISLLSHVFHIGDDFEKPPSTKELNEILDNTDQNACAREKLSKYFSCEENCKPLSKSEMEYTLSICKIEEESKKKEEENRKLFEMQRSAINKHNEEGK
ncbi:hypothetical protein [Dickeya poaceiphila]|uniref:Uncharacterized protein n=1 Tax=Dickeya poaceiphila TaxID=568768 RepID=A0A5B8HQM9_9GAMM|nr:hypothetical protein [Dickeya poaceiphila]QDX30929.1 hypothetical protein Dpoa569_0002878 [Dickeya poaceiphila]